MTGRHAAPKRPKRTTETSDYVAMMYRIIAGWGDRIAADPEALTHLPGLITALRDDTDRGIAQANENGYPQAHMAAILGVSQQAVGKRVRVGKTVLRRSVRLAIVRGERAAGLRAARVPDVHGSQREQAALKAVGE